MRGLNPRLASALDAIDAANADDPTHVVVRGDDLPLALAHGRLASSWVARLRAEPDDALVIAARAHHLRRWEVPRASYPEGRPGYLRWRRDQKARHARDVEAIMATAGYDAESIQRAQQLIRRDDLGTDADAQVVEDAACLVFIETQLVDVADRFQRDHLLDVIRKTASKMSPAALELVAEIPLAPAGHELLSAALSGST